MGISEQYQQMNQEYFVGISIQPNATGISARNWEPIQLMNS